MTNTASAPPTTESPGQDGVAAAPGSRTEVVCAIRQRILDGDLVPGQRLVEAELCALLNTSRSTVRLALMDLAHEGLIERIANRGARVRVVTLEEALQIAEVRLAVESLCVARAAERISDAAIVELQGLRADMDRRAAAADIEGFAEATSRIFRFYVALAEQPVAGEMLERLRSRNARHRFRLTFRSGRAQIALPYWQAIVDAICQRDPIGAQGALHRLVHNIEDSMKAVAERHTPFALAYTQP